MIRKIVNLISVLVSTRENHKININGVVIRVYIHSDSKFIIINIYTYSYIY